MNCSNGISISRYGLYIEVRSIIQCKFSPRIFWWKLLTCKDIQWNYPKKVLDQVRKGQLENAVWAGCWKPLTLGQSFHTRQLSVLVFRIQTFWNETDTPRPALHYSKAHHVYVRPHNSTHDLITNKMHLWTTLDSYTDQNTSVIKSVSMALLIVPAKSMRW